MCLYVSVYNSCYAVVHFSVADITIDLKFLTIHTLDHTSYISVHQDDYIACMKIYNFYFIYFIIFACNMVWDNCSFSLCNGCLTTSIDVNNCYLSRDQSLEYM